METCLRVFCDKTVVALQLYGEKCQTDVSGTVHLLKIVTKWWKIVNVKQKGLNERLREPLHAVISDKNDPRLDFLQSFGVMCLNMAGKQGNHVRQLLKDTALSMRNTHSLISKTFARGKKLPLRLPWTIHHRSSRKGVWQVEARFWRNLLHQRTTSEIRVQFYK